jgi:hypothetical protein
VTRADLAPGVQAVQAAHAAVAFAVRYPDIAAAWEPGGYLLLLAAPDELHLHWLLADAQGAGHSAMPFHEPDLGNELTAVAVHDAARLCAGYPLALQSPQRKENRHARDQS